MQDMSSPPAVPDRMPERVRHVLRFRVVQLRHREQISPGMLRLTFGGDDLQGFESPGFDDHVKLIFPDPVTGVILCPKVGPNGAIWPDDTRPVMRDYTPRHYDKEANLLTVDFALHEAGPATAWALAARLGDSLGVGGPKGSMIIPMDFDGHLLVGDETALPAIARRVRALPPSARAIVLVEVDSPAHVLELPTAAQVTIRWVYRSEAAEGASSALPNAVADLMLPTGDCFAWVACETLLARELRATLVERGWPAKRIKAAGYWRRGKAASHEPIEG